MKVELYNCDDCGEAIETGARVGVTVDPAADRKAHSRTVIARTLTFDLCGSCWSHIRAKLT